MEAKTHDNENLEKCLFPKKHVYLWTRKRLNKIKGIVLVMCKLISIFHEATSANFIERFSNLPQAKILQTSAPAVTGV